MVGLIGRKVGMTQVFDDTGKLTPVTVISVEPNVVVGHKTPERDGYAAVILGAEEAKPQRLTKPVRGQYEKAGVAPQRKMVEFADFHHECAVGDTLGVDLFTDVGFVDDRGDVTHSLSQNIRTPPGTVPDPLVAGPFVYQKLLNVEHVFVEALV